MRLPILAAIGLLAAAAAASAQTETPTGRGRFGTTVSMQAGLTSGSMDAWGGALGGTLLQELGSRWALEASAAYIGETMGADSLSINANVLFHLRPIHERASPYLALGGGLYHTSFDREDGRMYGARGVMDDMGMMSGRSGPGGYGNAHGHMPGFYANRLPVYRDGRAAREGHASFTDPAISAGGGIRVELGSRMFLRPDGRVLVVMSGGESMTVGMVAVNFGWRF